MNDLNKEAKIIKKIKNNKNKLLIILFLILANAAAIAGVIYLTIINK